MKHFQWKKLRPEKWKALHACRWEDLIFRWQYSPNLFVNITPIRISAAHFAEPDKLFLKFVQKRKRSRLPKQSWKKKKLENSSFPFHTILQSYNNQQCGTSTVLETQIDGIKLKVRNKLFFIFTFKWFFTRVPRPFTLGKWEKNSFFSSDSTTG